MDSNKKKIFAEVSTSGISMWGDGATVHHTPLLNILCISGEQLGIDDCTTNMEARVTKNVLYIAILLLDKIEEVDPDWTLLTCVYFNGAKMCSRQVLW